MLKKWKEGNAYHCKFAARGSYETGWADFLNSIPGCAGKADNTGVRFLLSFNLVSLVTVSIFSNGQDESTGLLLLHFADDTDKCEASTREDGLLTLHPGHST